MLCCFLFFVSCSKRIENQELPSIKDWSNGFLFVTGRGILHPSFDVGDQRYTALQEARRDAFFQLRREVYALPIDSKNRVEDLVLKDEKLVQKINRFIDGAKVVAFRIIEEEKVEVDMELYLGASLKSLLGLVEKPRLPNKNQNSKRR
ncbi:MAG TPA: hypothetical protein VGB26_04620 [Nitrospiria bacterium]